MTVAGRFNARVKVPLMAGVALATLEKGKLQASLTRRTGFGSHNVQAMNGLPTIMASLRDGKKLFPNLGP